MRFLTWVQRHPAETVSTCGALTALAVGIASPFWDKLDTKPLLVTILLVLGLLLSALVTDWFLRLSRIERDVAAIARPRAEEFLRRRSDLAPVKSYCGSARTLRVCGVTLAEVSTYKELWLRLAREGAHLQFIFCTREQIDKWAIAGSHSVSADVLKNGIDGTLARFADIRAEVTRRKLRGSIEWRHPVSPPRLAMVHVDNNLSTERLLVELPLHGFDAWMRPSFDLSGDDSWLSDFRRVSDDIWDGARPGK